MSSDSPEPPNNGSILAITQIIRTVMSSAAEAELVSLYINGKEYIIAQHTLEKMGHKQPTKPVQTDNTMALVVVKNNVMKKLKLVDMTFHWLQ